MRNIKIGTIIAVLALIALGFGLGRWTTPKEVKTEFVQGPTIIDSIPYDSLVPYQVLVPAKPVLPLKPDTVRIPGKPEYITRVVDTAQIIAEYIKENRYTLIPFDDNDTTGTLRVDLSVQYNKLQNFKYDFTPIQKQTTIIKKRVFSPFAVGSANSLGYVGAGGGFFINNFGVAAKYITDFKLKGYEAEIYLKL